ncbi:MAG: hypothetical protein WBM14_04305, partial [Terracidiphilus sp.]
KEVRGKGRRKEGSRRQSRREGRRQEDAREKERGKKTLRKEIAVFNSGETRQLRSSIVCSNREGAP